MSTALKDACHSPAHLAGASEDEESTHVLTVSAAKLDKQSVIVQISFAFVYALRVDILADDLAQARARGAVFSVLGRRAPWGLEFGGRRPLTAHLLLQGEALLESPDLPPAPLRAKDVALVRRGAAYRLVSHPGAAAEPIAEARHRGSDAGATDATILCGAYVLEGTVGEALLDALPRVVVIPGAQLTPAHATAIELLAAEAAAGGLGQQTLLDRLLDVNLVHTLRAWWSQPGAEPPAWYRAAADHRLRPVLEAMHADPAQHWDVPALAHVAGMSRAAFSARFTAAVGQSPARYLTTLRMQRAKDALIRTDAPLSRIAADAGYRNEYAFATAFRRRYGLPPGRWRAAVARSADGRSDLSLIPGPGEDRAGAGRHGDGQLRT
ncbi:AraC family transcriptional regulator [Amycolatopsis dongchuanensis]|uniref:AraC family transcriptional regulator n=1 Tax=Amycolatopsis TaxID=1813 RepID=UPI0031F78D6E